MALGCAELHRERPSSLSRRDGCKVGLLNMTYTELPQSFFLLLQVRCQQAVPRGQQLPREITHRFIPSTKEFVIHRQTRKPRQKQADPRSHSEGLPVQALVPPKHRKSSQGQGGPCQLQGLAAQRCWGLRGSHGRTLAAAQTCPPSLASWQAHFVPVQRSSCISSPAVTGDK